MPRHHPHHPLPAPLDVDGVGVVTAGTVLWGVAAIVLGIAWPELNRAGDAWWLWTALVGFGLGLFGSWFVRRRRSRIRAGTDATTGTVTTAGTNNAPDTEPDTEPDTGSGG